ncbi:MAG: glycerol-3-phosphate dehydrogenase/oxidase [Saprospiraceae bacterium]
MEREIQLQNIKKNDPWDIVIIGGGATGLGAALDAATRGFKTLCIEKTDFSKGTSSRSTKLIHGGVRYLAQGNISMVKSALYERWFLLKNAPGVTKRIPFVLPVYNWISYLYYGLGLKLYNFLSGKLSIGNTQFLSKSELIEKIPDINQKSLKGGVLYFDGQFDDSQICVSLARTAIHYGATVMNHMEAQSFIYSGQRVSGVQIKDGLTGEIYQVNSKVVINATGVFVDQLIRKDNKDHKSIISPSQGIHLVVDKKFYTSEFALLIPKTTDGRVLFAVPWHDKVVIGTTDGKVDNISEEPIATSQEIDFVLSNFNKYTLQQLAKEDIKSIFAGLRPLVSMKDMQSTADLLRDHTILVSDTGLVSITGGKWTTYRKMAKDVINKSIQVGGLPFVKCITKNVEVITQSLPVLSHDDVRLHPDYPYTTNDVLVAVKHEMACTLEDVLARRIRLLFMDAKVAVEVAPMVCKVMQDALSKDDHWYDEQLNTFNTLAKNYLTR